MSTGSPPDDRPVTRRGRPRVAERLEQVGTSLPVPYYERLKQFAHEQDMSVSKVVRQLLILRLR